MAVYIADRGDCECKGHGAEAENENGERLGFEGAEWRDGFLGNRDAYGGRANVADLDMYSAVKRRLMRKSRWGEEFPP
ncbi:MAG: hypothetical protein HY329_18645 [Chloroflexi bacterium]|nr:hypothetical protein [Chloroflexota bacterium]